MADLLTHVLVVYVLLTVASWLFEEVEPHWVPVAMGGAAIPDLAKVRVLIDAEQVAGVLGVPFSFGALSTLGGVVLVGTAITMAFERRHWRKAYAYLLAGGVSSLVVDGLRVWADGHASAWLYPATWWRPPTPSLYVSSDPRVAAGAVVVAAVVAAVDTSRRRSDSGSRDSGG